MLILICKELIIITMLIAAFAPAVSLAIEFSSENLLKASCTDNSLNCPKKLEPIKDALENPEGRVTVKYTGVPVTVPASKLTNVVKFPYPIKNIGSSKFCPDKALTSTNCIAPENIGKAEKQFSVVPVAGQDTDFAVVTANQTFIITLRPVLDTPAYIEIVDETVGGASNNTKADDYEKSIPYVELLLELIGKTIREEQIEGYQVRHVSKIHETPDLVFILKKEVIGVRFKVAVIDVINRSKDVIQLREDSELLQNVIARIAGQPLATTVSREFLQPNTSGAGSEHVSTVTTVVRR